MDERGANIDILFRNGLKDYEVLPPPEVWNNIRPAIRKNQQPIIILRAAAMIAVLLSLSFLAYKWSAQISSELVNNSVAFNPESDSPFIAQRNTLMTTEAISATLPKTIPVTSLPINEPESAVMTINDEIANKNIESTFLKDDMSYNKNSIVRKSDLVTLSKTNKYSSGFKEPLNQYLPEIQTKNGSDRWTIAALASPTYYANFNTGKDKLTHELMSEEQPLISYAGGLALSYKISKRFSVQSGLYYSSFGNELSGISSYGGFQKSGYSKGGRNFEVLTANGTVYTSNSDIFLIDNISDNRIISNYDNDSFDPTKADLQYLDNSLLQKFSYLELPVIVRYKLIDRAIDFNIIGGLSSNLLVTNSVYTTLNGGKYEVGKTEGLNQFTFSSSLGMGMEYSFTKNLSLNLEPTFRYYINPYSEISGIKIHPYTFGIFSGLSYKF
jgi:hypothetical protein